MLLEELTAIINERFTNWQFVGSIVDWHYLDGQVWVKDFDIRTSDPFEPTYVSEVLGPRYSFAALGRRVDVFAGQPTGWIETPEERVGTIRWLMGLYPDKRAKYEDLLQRYARLQSPQAPVVQLAKSCPHRGDQVETIICDQCGQGKGQPKPVYSCALHGRCTHRLERRGQESQDPPIRTCIGCPDGPWAA